MLLIAGLALPTLTGFTTGARVSGAKDVVAGAMADARRIAIERGVPVRVATARDFDGNVELQVIAGEAGEQAASWDRPERPQDAVPGVVLDRASLPRGAAFGAEDLTMEGEEPSLSGQATSESAAASTRAGEVASASGGETALFAVAMPSGEVIAARGWKLRVGSAWSEVRVTRLGGVVRWSEPVEDSTVTPKSEPTLQSPSEAESPEPDSEPAAPEETKAAPERAKPTLGVPGAEGLKKSEPGLKERKGSNGVDGKGPK